MFSLQGKNLVTLTSPHPSIVLMVSCSLSVSLKEQVDMVVPLGP